MTVNRSALTMPRRSFLLVPVLFHGFLLNPHAIKSLERTPTCTHRACGMNMDEPENISEPEPFNFTSHLRTPSGLDWIIIRPKVFHSQGSLHLSARVFPRRRRSDRQPSEQRPARPSKNLAVEKRRVEGLPFSAEDVEILDVDYMFSKELCTLAFWYVSMSKYGSWGRNRGNHKYVVMCKDTYLMKASRYGYLAKSTALHMTFSPTWHDH